MSDRPEPSPSDEPAGGHDPGADTGKWQAFARSDEHLPPVTGGRSPTAFRLVTLLVGAAVLAGLIWLLLQ